MPSSIEQTPNLPSFISHVPDLPAGFCSFNYEVHISFVDRVSLPAPLTDAIHTIRWRPTQPQDTIRLVSCLADDVRSEDKHGERKYPDHHGSACGRLGGLSRDDR